MWKLTLHLAGPIRFVLAGSGHIAGVVNPPASGKYQYWINEAGATDLDDFVAGAVETKGSWWPDWIKWIAQLGGERVPAKNARIPSVNEELGTAPGRYVRTR